MAIFSCMNNDREKPLVIENATAEGVMDGQKCEKGSGLPDMCMIKLAY